jgi:PAS domain S-box-containing protein
MKKEGSEADDASSLPGTEERLKQLEAENARLKERVESLEHSGKLHREALETAQVGTWQWDLNSDQLHWSDEVYNLFDTNPDRFDGSLDAYLELIHEKDRDKVYKNIEETLNNKHSDEYQVKHRIYTVDGSIRWLHSLGRLITDPQGIPRKLMGVTYDVTDTMSQRQTNQELQQKYQLLAEQSLFGLYILQDEKIIFSNNKAANLLEYTPDEIIGINFFELLTPEDGHRVRKVMEARSKGQLDVFEYELNLKQRSGSYLPVLIHSGMIRYNGKPAILGTVLDITDRRKAEQILHQKEQRISQIFDQIPAIVWTTDKDLIFTSSSGSGLELLDTKPNEVAGKSLYEYFQTDDDSYTPIQMHRQALRGEPARYEFEYMGRVFQSAVDPLTDRNGEIVGCIANAVDITEQKSIQANLRQTIAEKEVLLAEVHHRVKNNLALIHAMLELQQRKNDQNQVIEELMHTKHRVKSIALVHELLYSSDNLDQIDMKAYITKLSEVLVYESPTEAKVDLDLEIDPVQLPVTHAVPTGLIINELINNALHHAFDQTIAHPEIALSFKQHGDTFHLLVRDNGIGLNQNEQLDYSNSLGLNIVDKLTQQMNAEYELNRNGGTKIDIQFDATSSLEV